MTVTCLSRTTPHVFCSPCLCRQVEEHLFGNAALSLSSRGLGRELGVKCMSIDGCEAGFEERELRRVLGGKRWRMLERRVADAAVEGLVASAVSSRAGAGEGGRRIVRCPAQGCPYAEEREEPDPFAHSFPFWTSPLSDNLLWWTAQGVDALFFSLYSILVLTALHLLVLLAIFLLPHRFTPPPPQPPLFPIIEPHRALRTARLWTRSLALAVLARKEGAPNLLRCRNTPDGRPLRAFGEGVEGCESVEEVRRGVWPCLSAGRRGGVGSALEEEEDDDDEQRYCGLVTCLLCSASVMPERGAHRCYGEEKDGLRLAVERARSEAVKRVCGRCGLSFVKEGGCNKMSCRCGAASCFVCRQEISDTEGYAHFCQHFRAVRFTLGDCTECTKCNLWRAPDDDQAAAVAAKEAQERWSKERRGGIKLEVQEQQIGPALEWEDQAFAKLQRVCESLLRSIVY
ncbi:hypothetical protein BCR35DRAFT_302003 [Leucosporidium creatinivorum]|uniref:RING-type domain-containing protein n=1 Tax=Leucosporidium creatinivorum TaxID=106004 RepID=A0A1Y2FVR0_9BASI|nr:hypothetical protein BCR35DRAFT_302003 [Leucosporidium creatinivorum]